GSPARASSRSWRWSAPHAHSRTRPRPRWCPRWCLGRSSPARWPGWCRRLRRRGSSDRRSAASSTWSGPARPTSPPAGCTSSRARAVGALVTSMFLAYRPLRWRIGRTLFRVIIMFGVATVVFGVSSHFAVSLIALGVLGAADVVSVVIRSSLVQIRTPVAMLGRVSAVHSLFTGTSNQLGAFVSGSIAALIGAVPAVLLGGLGTIGIAALWMFLFP